MRWRIDLEYDGRGFCGWQRQAASRTVQEVVESALSGVFGGERITTTSAGRTDTGVHALGQVVSFAASTPRRPDAVRKGMNALLPDDVAVYAAQEVPDAFHARFSAIDKTYRYILLERGDRSPFWLGRAFRPRRPLDWTAVHEGIARLEGTHDFSAFRGPNCAQRTPVRSITRASCTHVGDGVHHLEFVGPGFLRYQVRIMVGTLLEAGWGRRTPESITAALASGRREDAGRTAPPDGLYLVNVRYPETLPELPASVDPD